MIYYRCDLCGDEQEMSISQPYPSPTKENPTGQVLLALPGDLKETVPNVDGICHKCYQVLMDVRQDVWDGYKENATLAMSQAAHSIQSVAKSS